jgi:hypothetical protein
MIKVIWMKQKQGPGKPNKKVAAIKTEARRKTTLKPHPLWALWVNVYANQ